MGADSRLALILADVFVPTDAAVPVAGSTQACASLERIARFARGMPLEDWRDWAVREWQLPEARGWRATPLGLEARLDHVRVAERGCLYLDAATLVSLADDFQRTFGPQYTLRVTPRGDYELLGLAYGDADVVTTDPATLLGADLHPGLARGAAARALRGLAAEIEMWLHAHPLNEVRRRRGLAEISTLWLWRSFELESLECEPPESLEALRDALRNDARVPAVVLWPMTRSSLATVEHAWLAPALASIAAGELAQLDLIANRQLFSLRRVDLWKRWRRSRTWLEAIRGVRLRSG